MQFGDVFLDYAALDDSAGMTKEIVKDPAGMTKETIRTYFPETWIWELVSVG